ncbi:MAG TPA: hypothetical protein VMX55_11445 [candidate division Zixibacteria bacterium]|nr:hypothetical protein [candidate division Zixibacteria bacterium]
MITVFNLYNSIAWIAGGLISAVISIIFLSKNPRKRLNQLFSAGFIGWSLSLIFNGINFAVAYKSLLAANILRDICIVAGVLGAMTLFLGTIGIYFGAEKINWFSVAIITIIAIILATLGVLNDWVVEDVIGGYKTTDNWLGKISSQVIPSLFIVVGIIFLLLTYKNSDNKAAKKRIGYFSIGFSTIIFGMLMFLIDSFITVSPYIFLTIAISTWAIGPILMLIGFYVKSDASPYEIGEQIGNLETQTLDPKQDQKLERPS